MKFFTSFLFAFAFMCASLNVQAQTGLTENTFSTLSGIPPCHNLSVSDSICSGEVYTFPDGTTQTITMQVVYTCTLQTVITPCDSIIETTVKALPVYNRTETFFDICPGNNYTFPDGSVQFITEHTEYTSYLQTMGSQCDSVINTVLNTTDLTNAVSVNGNVITASQGNAGYQWVNCDNGFSAIQGQNNQSYTAPDGNFAVIIYKGPCTDTSACQAIGTVGMADLKDNAVVVYPNPSNGKFKVNLGAMYNEVNVIIRNVVGEQVYAKTLQNTSLFTSEIETADGIYFMELRGSDGLNVVYKIVKDKGGRF